MKDKILLGLLIVIVAGGTVVGIFDSFVEGEANPILFGLCLGVIFTVFTPGIWLTIKYVFNGVFLYFPILRTFVILRGLVTLLLWWIVMGVVAAGVFDNILIAIVDVLIVIAHIAFRIYRIKNPEKADVEVNGEKV